MKIDGACHCGYLTYEATVNPDKAVICHCTDCQILSGTAFRTAIPAPGDAFRFLTGSPKEYVKTAESGRPRIQAFCPECGTQIYAADPGDSPYYFLRIGTCRQRSQLVPKTQVWCRSKLSWVDDIGEIMSVDKQPPMPGK